MSNTFGSINLLSGSNKVELYTAAGLSTSYELPLPSSPPANNQTWQYSTSLNKFVWIDFPTGSAPTVVDLALTPPSSEFNIAGSPYGGGTGGNFALTWKNQTQKTFFAAPNGATGVPTFRTIQDSDLPANISASKINGALTTANIPAGTNATSFQIDASNSGAVIKNNVGVLEIYNAGQSSFADLKVRNLILTGNIDEVTTTTVNLGDTTLLLNANFVTGSPTENAGLNVRRGSSTNASNIWDEANDVWVIGLDTNLLPSARRASATFVSSDVVSNAYTFTHNLTFQYPVVAVIDNTGKAINVGITYSTVNTCSLDLSRLTITGTWRVTAVG